MGEAVGDNPNGQRAAHRALRESLGRAKAALERPDDDDFFTEIAICLTWIVALDDGCKAMPGYVERRESDSIGRTILGLRWARGESLHQLTQVHIRREGLMFPFRFPATFGRQANWLPSEDTPWNHRGSEADRKRYKNERDRYDETLADGNVVFTVEAAQEFLWVRAIPGPDA